MQLKLDGYDHLKLTRNGAVLTVAFDRPERYNAFNPAMHHALARLLLDLAYDEETRVVVLTGEGRAFSAGGDMSAERTTPESFAREAIDGRNIVQGLLDCEKPIICRLNGDAIGLGATIALLCDMVVAADTARIADPHVRMGLVAGDGGVVIWPALVGPMLAKYYLLTGDMVSAPEAQSLGLITRAVPAEALDAAVAGIADKLVAGAPLAIRFTKRSINAFMKAQASLQFDLSLGYEGVTILSEDHEEAKAAFLAKRKPQFRGR
jgi:enoyl-CoA hydratase